jgi:hypothetical protein
MNEEAILKNYLEQELALDIPAHCSFGELKEKLSRHINQLVEHDFEKLVRLLYRIDVNEAKLKHILREHPNENAGNLIAELIIERQIQKINTREQFKPKQSGGVDEEKW